MTLLEFDLLVLSISIIAGILGSLLGLGGGIIVIPALTLLFKIDIRYAIGASVVSVIATSSSAAAAYVRERMTNVRVAMVLELATTSGALTGAYLAGLLEGRWLYIIFAVMMAYSSFVMLRKRKETATMITKAAPWADYLRLHSSYFDKATGEEVRYRVVSTRIGLALMYGAGIVSGLLGIGSGALKVPAMDLAMRLPIKVSTATSNFMIGVTAAASAGVYFMRGDIDPYIAAPVATGVLIGAAIGPRIMGQITSTSLRVFFVLTLLVISVQMLLKGVRG
ncbi:sulfite exporter TauE/SafE family protein [Geomonas sp. RF6]|uniref:sulfite exporter TauE/SafE family protein n=1 Tax=Geomonas sp. RF6 TaxID=2897342 RepID=UPI001E62964E|nr:sulfite exporter TauE/SafE family protein [Geomonas sp. RF6]UFS69998.1 sulfite exporter TauE/SafE family protein [Geomonas sp. RF6]